MNVCSHIPGITLPSAEARGVGGRGALVGPNFRETRALVSSRKTGCKFHNSSSNDAYFIIMCAAFLTLCLLAATVTAAHPNILMIVVDDLGWNGAQTMTWYFAVGWSGGR